MRLVDDLMEPFRPIVDLKVWQLRLSEKAEISPEAKRALVNALYDDMQTEIGVTPVMECVQRLATSLAQVYLGERKKLDLPLPRLPFTLAAGLSND